MSNPFFKNHGPILISEILKILHINNAVNINPNHEVIDIKDLYSSNDNDVTFFKNQNRAIF